VTPSTWTARCHSTEYPNSWVLGLSQQRLYDQQTCYITASSLQLCRHGMSSIQTSTTLTISRFACGNRSAPTSFPNRFRSDHASSTYRPYDIDSRINKHPQVARQHTPHGAQMAVHHPCFNTCSTHRQSPSMKEFGKRNEHDAPQAPAYLCW